MGATEFLHAIWPTVGWYALATPYTPPGSTKRVYAHKTFDSVDAAAQYATRYGHQTDMFFAVHTLKEPRVWNPNKTDRKTGELGAYEVRTQANMAMSRCFFFDLDVGASTGRALKYPSQVEALAGIRAFCQAAQLPKPWLTSSGGGVHVYWALETPLESTAWRPHAHLLRQLARHHGLRADPARTTDTASVLRVPGTHNLKDPKRPRPVKVLLKGTTTPTDVFLRLIQDAIVRAGITPSALPVFQPEHDVLGSNLTEVYDGPPTSFKALVSACRQLPILIQHAHELTEPEWYHAMNLIRFTENGAHYIKKIAARNPHYDPASHWIEGKLAQLEAKQIKPTSCAKLAEVCGDEPCIGCAFAGKVKSPIVAARYKDPAPAPVVVQVVGPTTVTTPVPDPPEPFLRLKSGGIAFGGKNRDGEETHTVIFPLDLYPVRRIVNPHAGVEQHLWHVVLPREGVREFLLDADALYDRRKFVSTIANHGLFPTAGNVPYLQDFMIAYIAELQRQADAELQSTHLGWLDDHSRFVLPDKVLMTDGTARPAMLSLGAQRATQHVHKKGDLATQVQLLRFYDHPAYLPNQFFIMAGLAAPLFYATGHHGVIVNASGEAGASKSTSLYTAASFWGQPELYPINGTNNGATVRGRNERVTVLANLPVCVDEITHMPAKDAVDLAMSITQPGHRIRLETSGIERAAVQSYKATIMLATANNSLHGLLSLDNAAGTAGSMRVVEIQFRNVKAHTKPQADAYFHGLKQHYGHIGEVFIHHVLQHRARIEARVRALMAEIDQRADIQSSERFWSATIACVVVAAEFSRALGLTTFDPRQLLDWALTVQVPFMRSTVTDEYTSPAGILAEYLEHINGDILIVNTPASASNLANVIRAPRGQLLGHYDLDEKVLWVLKKGFKDYCARSGANFTRILNELSEPVMTRNGRFERVLSSKRVRKVLGAGTEFAKAQSWCFAINMAHPDVSGAVDLQVDTTSTAAPPSAPLTTPRPALHAVR